MLIDFRIGLEMEICLIFASVLLCGFSSAKADCNPCPQGAASCPTTASISAGSWNSYSGQCNDANYEHVLASIEVGQEDGDGDDFTVTVMDEDDYNKFQNGDQYSYYTGNGISTGGVGDGSYTCFQYSGQNTFKAGTKQYTVIKCVNLIETCHLRVKIEDKCVNPDPCAGVYCVNGYCSGGSCICNGGYSGNNCENYDPCYGVACGANSNCQNGHCKCNPGYTGPNCESSICGDVDCTSNGNCLDGRCQCINGYWGSSCSSSCSNVNCQNGGECIPSYGCQCLGGYAGQDCSQRTGLSSYGDDRVHAISVGESGSSYFPTTIVIICSCVGFVVILSIVIVSFALQRRARRRRGEASYTSSITPNGEPKVVLVSAMEQQ